MNILEKGILQIIRSRVSKWFKLEKSLAKSEFAIQSVPGSPEKSWPNPDKIPGGKEVPFSLKNISIVGHNLSSCISQGSKAIKSISNNPITEKKIITEKELKELRSFAKEIGIGSIGFTKLPEHLIFKDRAVLYNNAIVLTMEMDQSAIEKAPSIETFKMVMSTYNDLGIKTNQISEKLRTMGFQCHASHPLGGLSLYPPLAVEAGLGWFGRHGLLITPEFGSRQRISTIFINVDNLPVSSENSHQWIHDFCARCGRCIRNCPSNAILEQPVTHESGRKTHIIRDKCLPVFVNREGCSICIKECPYSKSDYFDIQKAFLK